MRAVNRLEVYQSPAEIAVMIEEKVADIVKILLETDFNDVDTKKIAVQLFQHFNPVIKRNADVSVEHCELIVKKKLEDITDLISKSMEVSCGFLNTTIEDNPRSKNSLIVAGDNQKMIDFIESLDAELYSPKEVGALFGKTSRTISNWILNRKLKPVEGLKSHKKISVSEVVRVYREKIKT